MAEKHMKTQNNLQSSVEAILFAAGEPVTIKRLAEKLSVSPDEIRSAAQELSNDFHCKQRGIRLHILDKHLQLTSAPEYADIICETLEERKPPPMSRAALEVLALAAYYQPITRAYVDRIRGVESGATVAKLCEKGLLSECGKLEVPGRPSLYRTTPVFLRTFGLSSLDELPDPENENEQLSLDDLTKDLTSRADVTEGGEGT